MDQYGEVDTIASLEQFTNATVVAADAADCRDDAPLILWAII